MTTWSERFAIWGARLLAFLAAAIVSLMPTPLAAGERQAIAAGFPATLVEPDGDHPVVLFIAGSGSTDRDGNSALGVQVSYLAKLSAGFAGRGLGSLRYDKRGVPGSRPVESEADVSIDTFADDATVVLDWLRRTFPTRPIVLLGHSEGGLVALSIAGKRSDIAGLVLIATPGLPAADTLRAQLAALEEPARSQAIAMLGEIEAGRTVDDVPATLRGLFRPSVQPFLRSLLAMRPAALLAALGMPALIVGGGTDLQVSRADFDSLVAARSDVRSRWFAEMNHVLVDAPADRPVNLAAYSDASRPLTEGLDEVIAGFAEGL